MSSRIIPLVLAAAVLISPLAAADDGFSTDLLWDAWSEAGVPDHVRVGGSEESAQPEPQAESAPTSQQPSPPAAEERSSSGATSPIAPVAAFLPAVPLPVPIVEQLPVVPLVLPQELPLPEPEQAPAPAPDAVAPAEPEPIVVELARDETSAPAEVAVAVVAMTASAGAAATGTWSWTRVRRFAFAAALYTRLAKERLLDHATRERLLAAIRQQPGRAVADLAQTTDIPRNTATYHLRVLERERLVASQRNGRNRLFFAPGTTEARGNADALAALRHETSRAMAVEIGQAPGVDQKALCARLGLSPSLAHWHADRLVATGLVDKRREGRFVRYYPGTSFALVVGA